MSRKLCIALALVVGIGFTAGTAQGAVVKTAVDVVIVIDESGSMAGEHAWVPGMVTALESGLLAAGFGTGLTNQYGLVGYGSSSHGASQKGHKHTVAGNDFGTATQFVNNLAPPLLAGGGTEDGYEAIQFALDNYAFRANAVTNIILITDEDRDVNGGPSLATLKANLAAENQGNGALLNSVLNINLDDDMGVTALGLFGGATNPGLGGTGGSYTADGGGGFTTSNVPGTITGGWGSTAADYAKLTFDAKGGIWDLNQLRAGGHKAVSFTAAFVDLKVAEIEEEAPGVVPEPGTFAIWGILSLVGIGVARRKRKAAAA